MFKLLITILAGLTAASAAGQIDDGLKLRYVSQAIRDKAPTVSEAKALYNKSKTLEQFRGQWLDSPDHQERIRRYFNDMFGTQPFIFIAPEDFFLTRAQVTGPVENQTPSPADLQGLGADGDGVYHLYTYLKSDCFPTGVTADAANLVDATAWWMDGGETIKICPTAVSAGVSANAGANECYRGGPTGIGHEDCGCGPNQILCFPADYRGKIMYGITGEFTERGVEAYNESWSWRDLFGGDQFYGDRWLYHSYLYQDKIITNGTLPSTAEMNALMSLPAPKTREDTSKGTVAYPQDSAARSGVATMPGFMRQFNNFRSRIRAITERLLCRDIDATLNVDNISVFVNTADLTDFDKAHGLQAGCDTCHYSLDNLGSAILGWDDNGFRQSWWNPSGDSVTWFPYNPSGLSHVFGETGNGPEFLMDGYIERGPGFKNCMAKTAWESFSGSSWESLTSAQRSTFVKKAGTGPRELIRYILNSDDFLDLRSNKLIETVEKVPLNYSFSKDVDPILTKSCGGSTCHSSGTVLGNTYEFIGKESNFKGVNKSRVNDGTMPPASSGHTITAEEMAILVHFLSQ